MRPSSVVEASKKTKLCSKSWKGDQPKQLVDSSTVVEGKDITSFRAELQAVRLLPVGDKSWHEADWVTLDNEAVAKLLNAFIIHNVMPESHDNNDMWQSLIPVVKKRAAESKIKATWTKGHADRTSI